MNAPCGCPSGPGLRISDPTTHIRWHDLVAEQGGPAGAVTLDTLRTARGMTVLSVPSQTVIDDRATVSGKHRSSQTELLEARARENARRAIEAGLTRPPAADDNVREMYR